MVYYGNLFIMDAYTNLAINTTTKKVAFRFTQPFSKKLERLYFYVGAVAGTPPWIKFGVQTTSGGLPTGTWICSTYAQYIATGPQVVEFWVDVTAGTVYAIVFEWYSGTCDGSNYISIRAGDTNNYMIPYDLAVDLQATTLFYDGVSWSDQLKDPCFILGYQYDTPPIDPVDHGFPYYENGIMSIYSTFYRGERFTPPSKKRINTLGMWVAKTVSAPADDLYFVLYNITDSLEVASVTVPKAEVGTTPTWIDKSISAVTLLSTKTYRIYAKSPASISLLACFRLYRGLCPALDVWYKRSWHGDVDVSDYSGDGGASWSTGVTFDFPFRFTEAPLPAAGLHASKVAPLILDT